MVRLRSRTQQKPRANAANEDVRRQAFLSELVPVLMLDADDRIILWNRASEVLYGYTREQALGRKSRELLQTKFPEPFEHILQRLRSGRQWHGELVNRSSSGTEIVVASEWVAYLDEGGALKAIIQVNSDISRGKRAEEARDRLAAIIESSDDAIISKTLEGIVTSWNAGAEKLLGYTAGEMVGQPISRIIPPEEQSAEAAVLQRLRRGERVEHYETVRLAKDGRRLDISLTISPIRDSSGAIVGASKIGRDITERKRTEAALRQAQAELKSHAEHLERAVAQRTTQLRETITELEAFSYSLSHDLRAPLRAINTFTHIVLEDYNAELNPEAKALLGKVLAAAQRMDHLMQDVLAFSRVSRQPIELCPVDVEKLVRELLSRPEFQSAGAEIALASPLELMLAHPPSLSQCITNLLSNALKFVAPGINPRIRISSEVRGDSVRLWIADNGIGIQPEDQRKVFEIFQRLNTEYEGTGIGLAIVKKAAERMGGTVGVNSQPGKGSQFWLELRRPDTRKPPGKASEG